MAKEKDVTPIHLKNLKKKYGDVIVPASHLLNRPTEIISVGPNLDIALSGGVPEGSWVIMSGPPKCGKSTTSLQIAR